MIAGFSIKPLAEKKKPIHRAWVLFVFALFSATFAQAQNFTIQSGQTETTQQTITGNNFTGVVEQGGVLDVTGQFNSVQVNGNNNTVTNNGIIGLDTTGINVGSGAVIDYQGGTGISIVNNGTISIVTPNIATSGVRLTGDNGNFTNNGLIRALTRGGAGVSIRSDNAVVTNNGEILADGVAAILQNDGENATIVNNGILSSINGMIGTIQMNRSGANITNTGSIIGIGNQDAIVFTTPTAPNPANPNTVINSGSIIAPLDRFAINFGADDSADTFTLNKGGIVQGRLNFGTGLDTFNVERGISLDYTFEPGGTPEVVNANGATFVREGNRIIIVDPSSIQVSPGLSAEIADAVLGTVSNRAEWTNGYADAAGASPFGIWGSPFGKVTRIQSNNGFSSSTTTVAGFVIGADAEFTNDFSAGVFGGFALGRTNFSGGPDNNSPNGFGGIYANYTDYFSSALMFGTAQGSYNRAILNNTVLGGIQHVHQDRDGYFIAPEATIRSEKFEIAGTPVQASARGRVIFENLDSVTDTANSIAINVGGGDTQTYEGRIQLAFGIIDNETTKLTLKTGVDFRAISGDTDSRINIGNQIVTAKNSPREDHAIGGMVGLEADHYMAENMAIFASAEFGVMSDTKFSANVRAGLKIKF